MFPVDLYRSNDHFHRIAINGMIDIITADKKIILFFIQGGSQAILVGMKNTLTSNCLCFSRKLKMPSSSKRIVLFHWEIILGQGTKVLGRLFPQSSHQLIHADLLLFF